MGEEDVRIIRGGMKYFDTNRTDNGEGKPLCIYIPELKVDRKDLHNSH
jgi:hypothetical protein